jgi:hypothetical protein
MLSKYQSEAQQALDDLFREDLLPFQLTAHKVTEENRGEIRIHFYDSRLHSIILERQKTISIKKQLREAVFLRLTDTGLRSIFRVGAKMHSDISRLSATG